jgi:hypothetical protein
MADLGALGKHRSEVYPTNHLVPTGEYADRAMGPRSPLYEPLRVDGNIGGTVTENGTPLQHCLVRVMWRKTGAVIASTRTGADGSWQIGGFDSTRTGDYVVWILDPAGGVVYNDAVYALIAPV